MRSHPQPVLKPRMPQLLQTRRLPLRSNPGRLNPGRLKDSSRRMTVQIGGGYATAGIGQNLVIFGYWVEIRRSRFPGMIVQSSLLATYTLPTTSVRRPVMTDNLLLFYDPILGSRWRHSTGHRRQIPGRCSFDERFFDARHFRGVAIDKTAFATNP